MRCDDRRDVNLHTPFSLLFSVLFSFCLLSVLFMSFFSTLFTVVFYSYTAFAPVATITIIATATTTYSRLRAGWDVCHPFPPFFSSFPHIFSFSWLMIKQYVCTFPWMNPIEFLFSLEILEMVDGARSGNRIPDSPDRLAACTCCTRSRHA